MQCGLGGLPSVRTRPQPGTPHRTLGIGSGHEGRNDLASRAAGDSLRVGAPWSSRSLTFFVTATLPDPGLATGRSAKER